MTSPDPEVSHAVMNAKIEALTEKVDELTAHVHDLLALKHKGLGALWLVSILIGAAFTTALSTIGSWLRGGT